MTGWNDIDTLRAWLPWLRFGVMVAGVAVAAAGIAMHSVSNRIDRLTAERNAPREVSAPALAATQTAPTQSYTVYVVATSPDAETQDYVCQLGEALARAGLEVTTGKMIKLGSLPAPGVTLIGNLAEPAVSAAAAALKAAGISYTVSDSGRATTLDLEVMVGPKH